MNKKKDLALTNLNSDMQHLTDEKYNIADSQQMSDPSSSQLNRIRQIQQMQQNHDDYDSQQQSLNEEEYYEEDDFEDEDELEEESLDL